MIFSIQQLEEKARHRPQGYKEEVLKLSKQLDETHYELSESNFEILAAKYRLPELPQMLKNVGLSIRDAIVENAEARSHEEIENCLTICGQCPFLIVNSMRCGVCGCYLGLKTRLKSWHCPKDKW